MKRMLFSVILIVVLASAAHGYDKPFFQDENWDRIQDLNFEISTLNLLNGLYLSTDQLHRLFALAKESKAAQDQFHQDYAVESKNMEAIYTQLRREVMAGTGISETTRKKAEELHQRELKLQFEFGTAINRLEQRATKVLSENQLHVIREFSPCLLPPHKLAEPTRAGQAKDTDDIKNGLRQLRALPDDQWSQLRDPMLDSHVQRVAPIFGLRTQAQKQGEKQRMGLIVEKSRTMSDDKFEDNLDALADEVIAPVVKLQESFRGIEPLEKRYLGFGKVGKLLLDPRCMKIYEERLSQRK